RAEDGKYEIQIFAYNNGNFTGTLADTVVVDAYTVKDKTVTEMKKVKVSVPSITWTGETLDIQALFDNRDGRKAAASVKKGGYVLVYGEDFTVEKVSGDDYTSAGEHSVVLRGTAGDSAASFVGDRSVSFKITGISASKIKISGLNTAPEYTGSVITLDDLCAGGVRPGAEGIKLYTVEKGGSTELSEDDYDVDMSQAGASGSFTVSFILKNRYTGTISKNIKVKPYNLVKDTRHELEISCSECVYSKGGSTPDVRVTCGGRLLREGIDYTLSGSNNKTLKSQPTVTVKGKGHYTGSIRVPFGIVRAGTDRLSLYAEDKDYKKNAGTGYFKVLPKVMDNGTALSNGKDISKITVRDCRYFYADSGDEIPDKEVVAPGTVIEVRVRISCPSDSPYTGEAEMKARYRMINKENNIKKAKVKTDSNAVICFDDGNEVVPNKSAFIVKLKDKLLKENEYDIVSIRNNRFVGTVTVEIAGRGEYGGRKKFTIRLDKRKLQ
ncbi:MAG: hypothetical protein IK123_02280, partial [Lachnospiraceae bacterium]|nr:hypothetical protein [Lachnospiraceae bacterium]